ncbi:mkkA [Symbiodinium sp. CCMP2592]|nr:mkkA [Symbiodinium sp. CCMP2592]
MASTLWRTELLMLRSGSLAALRPSGTMKSQCNQTTRAKAMRKGSRGLGLYHNTFANLAKWSTAGFSWMARAHIFVIAVNRDAGPSPVQPAVIMPKFCSAHCLRLGC